MPIKGLFATTVWEGSGVLSSLRQTNNSLVNSELTNYGKSLIWKLWKIQNATACGEGRKTCAIAGAGGIESAPGGFIYINCTPCRSLYFSCSAGLSMDNDWRYSCSAWNSACVSTRLQSCKLCTAVKLFATYNMYSMAFHYVDYMQFILHIAQATVWHWMKESMRTCLGNLFLFGFMNLLLLSLIDFRLIPEVCLQP